MKEPRITLWTRLLVVVALPTLGLAVLVAERLRGDLDQAREARSRLVALDGVRGLRGLARHLAEEGLVARAAPADSERVRASRSAVDGTLELLSREPTLQRDVEAIRLQLADARIRVDRRDADEAALLYGELLGRVNEKLQEAGVRGARGEETREVQALLVLCEFQRAVLETALAAVSGPGGGAPDEHWNARRAVLAEQFRSWAYEDVRRRFDAILAGPAGLERSRFTPSEGTHSGGVEAAALGLANALEPLAEGLLERVEQGDRARLAAARRDLWVCLGLAAFLGLGALALALGVARRLQQRLKGIAELARSVAEGDLSRSVATGEERETEEALASIREMTERLRNWIETVRGSSHQVADGASELSEFSSKLQEAVLQQDASTTEVMAATNEISATSRELAESMAQATEVARSTSDSAAEGSACLVQLETTMQRMSVATSDVVTRLNELNDRASSINTITSLIAKVADQTNLLSLNAAIEAEKAGEYGSGFSVVASEIRRLADQTAVAVLDIENVVKEILSAISASVMTMDDFTKHVQEGVESAALVRDRLGSIIEEVQGLTPRFEALYESMDAQSIGAGQIREAMGDLAETSKRTRESVETSASTVTSLYEAVTVLQEGVGRFQT